MPNRHHLVDNFVISTTNLNQPKTVTNEANVDANAIQFGAAHERHDGAAYRVPVPEQERLHLGGGPPAAARQALHAQEEAQGGRGPRRPPQQGMDGRTMILSSNDE